MPTSDLKNLKNIDLNNINLLSSKNHSEESIIKFDINNDD
jgi:hypothetical protein